MGNLEVLYKSIFEEENYKITAHAKLLTFLTKRVGHSRGADIAKLMSVALVPSD